MLLRFFQQNSMFACLWYHDAVSDAKVGEEGFVVKQFVATVDEAIGRDAVVVVDVTTVAHLVFEPNGPAASASSVIFVVVVALVFFVLVDIMVVLHCRCSPQPPHRCSWSALDLERRRSVASRLQSYVKAVEESSQSATPRRVPVRRERVSTTTTLTALSSSTTTASTTAHSPKHRLGVHGNQS